MEAFQFRSNREKDFFDSLCESSESSISTRDWWETPGGQSRFRRRIDVFRSQIASHGPNPRVLLIGAGDGLWFETLSESCDLSAIDISPKTVESLTKRLSPALAPRVATGDAHSMKFANETFDVVVANSTLHHLDLLTALKEISRVLKTDGQLVAFEPNRSNPQVSRMHWTRAARERFGLSPDEQAFRKREIKRLLREHFLNVEVQHFDFWHPSLGSHENRPLLFRILRYMERIPLVRSLSGSLSITATRVRQR